MTAPLTLVKDPAAVLHQPTREVAEDELTGAEVQAFIDELVAAVIYEAARPRGCSGLAAPQLGSDLRICAVNTTVLSESIVTQWHLISYEFPHPARADFRHPRPQDIAVLVNPVVKRRIGRRQVSESCLSVDDPLWRRVIRSKRVEVATLDRRGNGVRLRADHLAALVLEHEIGHLDGELFTDLPEVQNAAL